MKWSSALSSQPKIPLFSSDNKIRVLIKLFRNTIGLTNLIIGHLPWITDSADGNTTRYNYITEGNASKLRWCPWEITFIQESNIPGCIQNKVPMICETKTWSNGVG